MEKEKLYRYMSIDDKDIKNGQYITTFGSIVYKPYEPHPTKDHPHTYNPLNWKKGRILPEFMIGFIKEGEGIFKTKEREYACSKGTIFLLVPGEWHFYEPLKETGWTQQWVGFNGSYFHRMQRMGQLPETQVCYQLKDEMLAEFSRDMDSFLEYISQNPYNKSKNTGWLLMLLQTLQDLSESSDVKSFQQVPENMDKIDTKKVVQYIWENSHRQINVTDVANTFQTTTRTLERYFKQHHNRGVMQEIIHSKIYRVEKQLCETDEPIKTISYICGFTDVRNMIRAFKEVYNLTPKKYRVLNKR